jgi:hypothetical protein
MIFYQTWITQLSGYPKTKLAKLSYNLLIPCQTPDRVRQGFKDTKIMIDSGAFTNANPKTKEKDIITLEKHIEVVNELAWLKDQATFIQLDVIGDIEQTRRNYHLEIAAGIPVYPVVSCYGRSLSEIYKEIDYYMDFSDYIFVGGLVGTPEHLRFHIIKAIWKRYEYSVRIHLLGVSPNNPRVPEIENFYSTDTARLVINLRTGSPMYMRFNGSWELIDMPTLISVPSEECPDWLREDMKELPSNQARYLLGFYAAHNASKWYDEHPNPKYDKFEKSFHIKKAEDPDQVAYYQMEHDKMVASKPIKVVPEKKVAHEKSTSNRPPPIPAENWESINDSYAKIGELMAPKTADTQTKKMYDGIYKYAKRMLNVAAKLTGRNEVL